MRPHVLEILVMICLLICTSIKCYLNIEAIDVTPKIDANTNNKLAIFLFQNQQILFILHEFGILSIIISLALLNCNILSSYLFILLRFILSKSQFDIAFSFTSINFLIIVLSLRLSKRLILNYILILISGILSSLAANICIEFIHIVFCCFFSFLFLWLKNNRIGSDTAPDLPAILTVGIFMVSSITTFIICSLINGHPNYSTKFFSFSSTLNEFPILHSKVTISLIPILPSLIKTTDPTILLLSFTCFLASQLFRFIPLSTEGFGKEICVVVSSRLYDVGSLILVNRSHRTIINFVSITIFVFLFIVCKFFNLEF